MNIRFVTTFDDDGKGCRIVGYVDDKETDCSSRYVVRKYIHRLCFLRCGERGYKLEEWRSSHCCVKRNQLAYVIDIAEDPKSFLVKVLLEEDDQERAISIARKALDHYLYKTNESANEEARRRFCCGSCGLTFDSNTKNTRQKAELGDYWATRLGYEAKCPHCGGYAHECTEPVPFEQSASKTKQASKLLLSMENEHLEVWNVGADVCVCYAHCEVKNGAFLIGEFGIGRDFEEACEDYLAKICGKTLVFHACSSQRKEVTVLG